MRVGESVKKHEVGVVFHYSLAKKRWFEGNDVSTTSRERVGLHSNQIDGKNQVLAVL